MPIVLLVILWCVMAATPSWAVVPKTKTLQSAATATGNGSTIDTLGIYDTVALTVAISATATVTFEATEDGTTWASKVCISIANTSSTLATSATASGTYQCNTAGLVALRARISSYGSGTVTVTATASDSVLGGGGGGGGGTQYQEDAAHSSGDTGTMALGVRRDANTTLADTTGDYAPFQLDANGNLKVNVIAGGGSGGTSVVEDAAHSGGENITPLGCRRIDSAASSAGTSGDWATVDCDANGAVRVRIDSTAVGAASDDDDNSIAQGTTGHSVVVNIPYVNNGSAWIRDTVAGRGLVVEDAAETAGANLMGVGTVRRDTAASSAGTTGDNATVNTDALGLLWTRQLDPCSGIAKTHIAINISTATTTELTGALSGASTYYYVCSLDIVTAGANNVALVDDDTDGCGSPTAGLAGGTTAASGWNLAANGGIVKGNGTGTVYKAVTANSVLCLVTSAATQLSGSIQVVAAP